MANPQIVLYEPVYWSARRRAQRAPLSLLAIAGLLDKEGRKISIISPTLYDKPEAKLLEDCKNATCLGITSLTGYQIADGLRIAQIVRQEYPRLPIVWGGWHPTMEPQQTLESPYVDMVVRGQGESTFAELVHALEEGKPLRDILGLSYKEDAHIVHNPERPLEDINNFPPIPYHLIDVEKVLSNDEFGDRVLNYISSYGCPYRCSFCATWSTKLRRWSGLTASRMADDFERLAKDYKVDCIAVNDMQFFLYKDRVREFCQELIKRKVPLKWDNVSGNVRQLLKYEDEMWELLVKSGLCSIPVGAESGFPEALRFMNKALSVEETARFAEKAQAWGVKVTFSMMLGLPWDLDYDKTRKLIDKEIKLTLDLSERILNISNKHRVSFYIYAPYPGTPMYQRALELGLKPPQTFEGWSNWVIGKITTPWISPKQARLTQLVSEYVFFFMDPYAYDWVTARVRNRLKRLILKGVYKIFIRIAKFRWKFKFFALPIDYHIYRWGREFLGIA